MTIKPIQGTDDKYLLFEDGRVYSVRRKIFLSQSLSQHGYLKVNIRIDGIIKRAEIHRIVAIHFVPNPHNKSEVNHLDADKENNHYSNLEWCTGEENRNHAHKMGLRFKKLDFDSVAEIREMRKNKVRQIDIAAKFGIRPDTVSNIVRRSKCLY